MLTTIMFDLDGTLLPMKLEEFAAAYFKSLAGQLAKYGYEGGSVTKAVLTSLGAMVQNDGSRTNEEAFWQTFSAFLGDGVLKQKPMFEEYYTHEFNLLSSVCGRIQRAGEAVKELSDKGFRLVLASNPIFPKIAQMSRLKWAGVDTSLFSLYTSYENMRYSKPNPLYYKQILSMLDEKPEHCLMVGNDVNEDMSARRLGVNVFLLPACLINSANEDISSLPQGDFDDLLTYVQKLSEM